MFCKNESVIDSSFSDEHQFFECSICGRYIFPLTSTYLINSMMRSDQYKSYNQQELIVYLYHHKISNRAAFVGTEVAFEEYKKGNEHSTAFLVTPEIVENWYPKTFEERINIILLTLANKSKFIGDEISIGIEEVNSLFFITSQNIISDEWHNEIKFIIRYLCNAELIDMSISINKIDGFIMDCIATRCLKVTLSAKAWGMIYELQKNKTNNKRAFVAMRFGDATRDLRQKIKEGIESAGYEPRIMDEVEHNHQIVPEMLYEIRNSRFVIAELSHHNNGAYYEAGYAHGLDKEVIHICSEEALKNELHFDVAQINTIVYKDICEIPEKLKKRILATIC